MPLLFDAVDLALVHTNSDLLSAIDVCGAFYYAAVAVEGDGIASAQHCERG